MHSTHAIIQWEDYSPPLAMASAIDFFNDRTLDELLSDTPKAELYSDGRATFEYRLFGPPDLDEVDTVYVIVSGFAERAVTVDAGIKGLLIDTVLKNLETQNYAVVVVGGLFSFSARERAILLKRRSGALRLAAEAVTDLLRRRFHAMQTVTLSGFSMGGVLAPLIAEVITKQGIAQVERVCCGEPAYDNRPTTGLGLLGRSARASSYRNEQIQTAAIDAYLAAKTTPEGTFAMAAYRAKLYRPLVRRALSMHFVVSDLALQAVVYPAHSFQVQLQESLYFLAHSGVDVALMRAEHSVLCRKQAFEKLVKDLEVIEGDGHLSVILIHGDRADHGIEEQRSLSTPFLIKPELYQADSVLSA